MLARGVAASSGGAKRMIKKHRAFAIVALLIAANCAISAEPPQVEDEPQWVPGFDVLSEVLRRATWRMSEEEFKRAFEGAALDQRPWQLEPGSFRRTIVVRYPNTEAVFEFSGVVDEKSKVHVAVSSSLVGFSIKHPLKEHPDTPFRRPPASVHYAYLKGLHDAYLKALIESEKTHSRTTGQGQEYVSWEEYTSDFGTVAFVFWSSTSREGVFATPPAELIEADLEKERKAALQKTKDWPVRRCGNEPVIRREPPLLPDICR
jgi:hypothetical protein